MTPEAVEPGDGGTGKGPRRLMRACGRGLSGLALAGMVFWGTLAIFYSNLPPGLRPTLAAAFAVGSAALLLFFRPRRKAILGFLSILGVVAGWWAAIAPSNDRDWRPDVAILPSAEIDGDRVTIHNIRNCRYRSATDFDVRHYDRTFDLAKLRSVDLFIVYWGSPFIAHTMLSFGFDGGDTVCVSIETRMEKAEAYSTVGGFFKQYELTYVVADERDVVRLRTDYRNEDVYLYRLRTRPQVAREVFLDYLHQINALTQRPQWYNTLTDNCTSNIRGHTRPYAERSPWSWKLIVNGYIDEMIYENGAVDRGLPFAELKARSRINDRARAAGAGADFSQRIRDGLPGMNDGSNVP